MNQILQVDLYKQNNLPDNDYNFEEMLYKKNNLVYEKSEHPRVYAWKLENIVKYDEPIYCKGKLGLWNYE